MTWYCSLCKTFNALNILRCRCCGKHRDSRPYYLTH